MGEGGAIGLGGPCGPPGGPSGRWGFAIPGGPIGFIGPEMSLVLNFVQDHFLNVTWWATRRT